MKRVKNFLFENCYGASVAWLVLGAPTLAVCCVLDSYWQLAFLANFVFFVHAAFGVIMPIAIAVSLVKHRWDCAVGQFILMIVSAVGYVMAAALVFLALTLSGRGIKDFEQTERPWYGTEIGKSLPFAVQFRHAHPFLAEFDRRIVFGSGRATCLCCDSGGRGDFAVYALTDGSFYLMDRLDDVESRNEYRIDAKAESVELKCGSKWFLIPSGALDVKCRSDISLTVSTTNGQQTVSDRLPVRHLVHERRYLGRITRQGEFVEEGPEPVIDKNKMGGDSSARTDALPFGYERDELKSKAKH